ncbi:hypothetical protein DM02DRAFT_628220 [Periconia macrospinosa]|uniref:RING-type domain-containing protein n=1 Tax=Periconia macrospinosa TaxID=97972 RepID=A0A2V1DU01_9PLEO|nr:hypothetical protein DM02DRAFT_628220 [Periconia macrospinosa]
MGKFVEGKYLHYTTRQKTQMCFCENAKSHERWYPVVDESPELERAVLSWMKINGVDTCSKDDWLLSGEVGGPNWTGEPSKHAQGRGKTGEKREKKTKEGGGSHMTFKQWMVDSVDGGQARGASERRRKDKRGEEGEKPHVGERSDRRDRSEKGEKPEKGISFKQWMVDSVDGGQARREHERRNKNGRGERKEGIAIRDKVENKVEHRKSDKGLGSKKLTVGSMDGNQTKHESQKREKGKDINKEILCKRDEWRAALASIKGEKKAETGAKKHQTPVEAEGEAEYAHRGLCSKDDRKTRRYSFEYGETNPGSRSPYPLYARDTPNSRPSSLKGSAISHHEENGENDERQGSKVTAHHEHESKAANRKKTSPARSGKNLHSITEQIDDLEQTIGAPSFNPWQPSQTPPSEFSHDTQSPSHFPRSYSPTSPPSQRIFLVSGLTYPKRSEKPSPKKSCPGCHPSCAVQQKGHSIIQLKVCGHYVHQECVIDHFRSRDTDTGTCPECGVVLCKRSLSEKLDMDREAIFGVGGFTDMKRVLEVTVPMDDIDDKEETVLCASEEEVTVCLLRVLKAQVSQFLKLELETCIRSDKVGEVNWAGVVASTVNSFREKGFPLEKCRFILPDEAFFSFFVLAELVRKVNSSRMRGRRDGGLMSELIETIDRQDVDYLRESFRLAKTRLDGDMVAWKEQGKEEVECNICREMNRLDIFSTVDNTGNSYSLFLMPNILVTYKLLEDLAGRNATPLPPPTVDILSISHILSETSFLKNMIPLLNDTIRTFDITIASGKTIATSDADSSYEDAEQLVEKK